MVFVTQMIFRMGDVQNIVYVLLQVTFSELNAATNKLHLKKSSDYGWAWWLKNGQKRIRKKTNFVLFS